jgi:hypothetical protein
MLEKTEHIGCIGPGFPTEGNRKGSDNQYTFPLQMGLQAYVLMIYL